MIRCILLYSFLEKLSDNLLGLHLCSLEVIIDEDIVELAGCELHLGSSFCNSSVYGFLGVGATSDKPFAKDLDRWSLDKY